MKKTIFAILVSLCVCSMPENPCNAMPTEAAALESAIKNQDVGYSITYGSYATYEEARAAYQDTLSDLDTSDKFAESQLYIKSDILKTGNTYAVCYTIAKYRDINDVNWKQLAESFPISEYSDLEKTIWVHQWVCSHLTYSLGSDRTLSSCLSSGVAKCDEYAIMFANLLHELDIDVRCIDGIEAGTNCGHMWNMVKLNGKWYYCDVSMDDQTDSFDYFLKGSADDAFLMDHEKYMSKERLCYGIEDYSSYPVSRTNYFYYMESTDENRIDLSQYAGISKKAAKKAQIKSVTDGSAYSKKGSIINTKGISGVCFGKVKRSNGKQYRFLIQKY